MNGGRAAVSFDEIIQADRQRKKNEDLANEIFGRSKKANDSARGSDRRGSRTPSLASRVGVAKRSNSSTNVKNNPFNPPSRPSSATAQIARTNRIASAVNSTQQAKIATAPIPRGPGLSIKGTAGPFVVEASNFAPGTTAADIESALGTIPIENNAPIETTSCRIMASLPTVIAEMVFAEKYMADTVISTFNNQKADGRILHVHLKRHGPGSAPRKSESVFISEPTPSTTQDLFDTNNSTATAEMEDVDMTAAASATPYDNDRESANRDRESRRAEPDVQDGRYGFAPEKDAPPSQPREDRNGAGRRDEERDRERDRDRDRDRRYDDRRYDRRDDRGGSYRRDGYDGGGGSSSRGHSSHYGNGAAGRGFPQSGGRMYSDDLARGGRGGPRGGYRGGFR